MIDWYRMHFQKPKGNLIFPENRYIYIWSKGYEKLIKLLGSRADKSKKALGSGRAPKSNELDQVVYEWFEEEKINERVVTNYNIQTNARKVSSQQVINFTASNGSLRRWKTRFSLGLRQGTNDVQKVPGNYKNKIMSFHEAIMPLRHRWDYTHYNIANMDQTMVRFNSVLNYTNEKICAKTKNSSYRWK